MKNVSTKLAVATVVAGTAVAAGNNGTVVHAEELATPVAETTTQTQDVAARNRLQKKKQRISWIRLRKLKQMQDRKRMLQKISTILQKLTRTKSRKLQIKHSRMLIKHRKMRKMPSIRQRKMRKML